MERSVEIVVAGAVQGVAFRWQASVEAERLGVRGWVRNEPDGTVRPHLSRDHHRSIVHSLWLDDPRPLYPATGAGTACTARRSASRMD